MHGQVGVRADVPGEGRQALAEPLGGADLVAQVEADPDVERVTSRLETEHILTQPEAGVVSTNSTWLRSCLG